MKRKVLFFFFIFFFFHIIVEIISFFQNPYLLIDNNSNFFFAKFRDRYIAIDTEGGGGGSMANRVKKTLTSFVNIRRTMFDINFYKFHLLHDIFSSLPQSSKVNFYSYM